MDSIKTFDKNLDTQSMEAIVIKWGLWISTWVAIPASILGILQNWGTWKAEIIFLLAVLSICVRIFFEVVRKLDERDARKIQNEINRWEFEQKKKRQDNNNINNQNY